MELCRITNQNQPLEDHFGHLAALGDGNALSPIGRRMLELLAQLRKISGPPVWAVTSHADLNLVAGDDYRLPSLVTVRCGGEWFHVEYLMPAAEAPWPGSRVVSQTDDLDLACEMVAFGLGKATGVPYSVNKAGRAGRCT